MYTCRHTTKDTNTARHDNGNKAKHMIAKATRIDVRLISSNQRKRWMDISSTLARVCL